MDSTLALIELLGGAKKNIQWFWKKCCWRDLHCSYGVMRGLVLGGPTRIEVLGGPRILGGPNIFGGT